MQAFGKCRNYNDYLKILENHISNGTTYFESNEEGFSILCGINDTDDQKKIIDIFKLVDKELSCSSIHNDEMFKKIDYFLVLGRYYSLFRDCFDSLDAKEIFTLLMGEMSLINDSNKDFIRLFSNRELLDSIYKESIEGNSNDEVSLFLFNDYFFMMGEHYSKNPFDLNDKDLCDGFIKKMILKINSKTLHDGVMNMIEYWESNDEIRNIVLGGKTI